MNGTDMTVVEDTMFDDTVRMLTTGASRRTALRGLSAGLLALAGGGAASSALAKTKKKKSKKKRTQNETPQETPQPAPQPVPQPRPQSACSEVTTIAYLNVPSNGSVVETPLLKKGQIYHLRAQGWWSDGGEYAADAYARFRYHGAPAEHTLVHEGIRVGLSVNNTSPDLWGTSLDSYNPSHRYTMAIVGKDAPATLRTVDSDFTDNARDLYVEVVCIPI